MATDVKLVFNIDPKLVKNFNWQKLLSTPADKTEKLWDCGICKRSFKNIKTLNAHVERAHKEEKNEKARKTTEWKCGICKKYFSTKSNLQRHVRDVHSKKNTRGRRGKKYNTKEKLNRHAAAVKKKTVVKKDKENLSKPKGKVNSVAPSKDAAVAEKTDQKDTLKEKLQEGAALRENTGEKDNPHSKETPKLLVTKFTKYNCTCGKIENTYDASVRHAQEHLVELALGIENGAQSELKFDRHNRGDNNQPLIQTEFDYKLLLEDSWFNMFDRTDLSLAILTSSLYKYTRRVKLNWDSDKKEEGHCVPLYKCGACNLFVEPAKVETHCDSYRACVVGEPRGHKCPECPKQFSASNALKLHRQDHDTYKNLRFRIVTFNNEDDKQFNMALRQMAEATKQEKVSGSTGRQERNVLEKDVHDNATPVLKYCGQCKRSHSDSEDHNAYHENKRKKIIETIAREEPSSEVAEADAKKQQGKTEKEAEPEISVSDKGNIRKDNVLVHRHSDNRMANDSESAVVEWNSESDSEDDEQSFNTFSSRAQLNLMANHFRRILTTEVKVKQKPYNDYTKLQENRNDDDAVIGKHDQFDQCELTLGKIFGEDNNGADTLESDNESQSTEDLQRVLEGETESVFSDDE